VRKRQLTLQTVITVANYEYIFYWILDQSGEIEFETQATGILSTTPINPSNKDKVPFATRVADGVLAPYHQHIVSPRRSLEISRESRI
jgi:primary-amine oxidase